MHDHKINMATMIKHTHIKPNTGFCLTVPGGRAIYFVRQFESTDVFFKNTSDMEKDGGSGIQTEGLK